MIWVTLVSGRLDICAGWIGLSLKGTDTFNVLREKDVFIERGFGIQNPKYVDLYLCVCVCAALR